MYLDSQNTDIHHMPGLGLTETMTNDHFNNPNKQLHIRLVPDVRVTASLDNTVDD